MGPHNHNIVIEALAQTLQQASYDIANEHGITTAAIAPALSRACVDQWLGRFLPTSEEQREVLLEARLVLATMFAQALNDFEMLMVQGSPVPDIWHSIRSVDGADEQFAACLEKVTAFAQARYLKTVDPAGQA